MLNVRYLELNNYYFLFAINTSIFYCSNELNELNPNSIQLALSLAQLSSSLFLTFTILFFRHFYILFPSLFYFE